MRATTFYSLLELEQLSRVPDKDIDELLQLVRKEVDDRYYIRASEEITKRVFRKSTSKTVYLVIFQNERGKQSCDLLGFYTETGTQYHVSKSYIMTYLCGLLNGKEISVQK